jgi:uncharacterized 2Fe-2S/4Fe-4S cluster protein (DUF4445 family)
MQTVVVDALNQLAADLCAEAGVDSQEIVEAVIVGNTAMHHLLLSLSTRQLALAPFVPTISRYVDIKARDIGLTIAPGAYVHLPPNIAGFVGSDHVAMLIAGTKDYANQNIIALDIGTNTEISLLTSTGKISCVSCASGPAFEGYHIKDGTRATAGAIERVRITPEEVYYQTIEGISPTGICGSGILDAVAQLRLAGILTDNGRIKEDSHTQVRQQEKQLEFVLTDSKDSAEGKTITVTQNDIREIQLAKASIQTGLQVLLAQSDISVAEIDRVIIAGAFGSFIDISNAVTMGMLPSLPLDRFKQVGNAAGMGAKLVLLSTKIRAEAQALYGRVDYIELAKYPDFAKIFAKNCRLEPYEH